MFKYIRLATLDGRCLTKKIGRKIVLIKILTSNQFVKGKRLFSYKHICRDFQQRKAKRTGLRQFTDGNNVF